MAVCVCPGLLFPSSPSKALMRFHVGVYLAHSGPEKQSDSSRNGVSLSSLSAVQIPSPFMHTQVYLPTDEEL